MSDGKGCKCAAYSASDCGCPDVDWTPQEIYDLREKLSTLREENERLKKQVDASRLVQETLDKEGSVNLAVRMLDYRDKNASLTAQVRVMGEALRMVKIANHIDVKKPSEDCLKEHFVILLPIEDNDAVDQALLTPAVTREVERVRKLERVFDAAKKVHDGYLMGLSSKVRSESMIELRLALLSALDEGGKE